MEPLGHPNRPKIALSRLLTPYFSQTCRFSKTFIKPNEKHHFMTPRRSPRTTQDRPKTAPRRSSRASFFDFVFDIDFGPSWVASWPHLGSLLGSQNWPKLGWAAHPVEFKTTLTAQDAPRRPQDRPRRPQDSQKTPQDIPKGSQDTPKTTKNRLKTQPTTQHNTTQHNTTQIYSTLGGSFTTGLPFPSRRPWSKTDLSCAALLFHT